MPNRFTRLMLIVVVFTLLSNGWVVGAQSSITTAPKESFILFMPLVTGSDSKEQIEERTPNLRVYTRQENGKLLKTYQYSLAATSYKDYESNTWIDIDTRLVHDPATGSYHNAAAGFQVAFPDTHSVNHLNTKKQLLQLSMPNQPNITFSAKDVLLTNSTVSDNKITYHTIQPGKDLRYTVQPEGIKEEVILFDKEASATFAFEMTSELKPYRQPDGSWELRDWRETLQWRVPSPFGTDSNGVEAPMTMDFAALSANTYAVTMSVDPAWLTDPQRSFPVVLDPSIVLPSYIGGETYVEENEPTANVFNTRNRFLGKSTVLYSGSTRAKGITRIYTPINFDFLPGALTGNDIQSVSLVFTQYLAETSLSNGFNTAVRPVLSAWQGDQLSWQSQPTVGSPIASGIMVLSANGQKRWDITDWSKQILDSSLVNHGSMIQAEDENQGASIFYSSQCGGNQCPASARPFIEVQVQEDLLFGDGSDGDLNIPDNQTYVLSSPITPIGASGRTVNAGSNAGFNVGDLILLFQSNSNTTAGHYELHRIKSFTYLQPCGNWKNLLPLISLLLADVPMQCGFRNTMM